MKFSIITVVYNGAETLEQTILSVASQSHEDIEHIVVDGQSTDKTPAIINRHRQKLGPVLVEADTGLYDAMNKGINLASGDVVGFLNADDFYAHERVIERVDEVLTTEDVDSCYSDLVYVDPLDLNRIIRYWTSRSYQPGLFEKGWMPAHPTFFVRREVYEKYGSFDLDYRYQSDFELTARFIAVAGIRTLYLPEIMVKMRLGGTTNRSIGNIIRGNLESYRACKKLGLKVTPAYFITKLSMRIPQFFRKPASQ